MISSRLQKSVEILVGPAWRKRLCWTLTMMLMTFNSKGNVAFCAAPVSWPLAKLSLLYWTHWNYLDDRVDLCNCCYYKAYLEIRIAKHCGNSLSLGQFPHRKKLGYTSAEHILNFLIFSLFHLHKDNLAWILTVMTIVMQGVTNLLLWALPRRQWLQLHLQLCICNAHHQSWWDALKLTRHAQWNVFSEGLHLPLSTWS